LKLYGNGVNVDNAFTSPFLLKRKEGACGRKPPTISRVGKGGIPAEASSFTGKHQEGGPRVMLTLLSVI